MPGSFNDGAVTVCIDAANGHSIRGWAIDRDTSRFPDSLTIVTSDGRVWPITEDFRKYRRDVCDALSVDADRILGFTVNLFDLLNRQALDYSLAVEGTPRWSLYDSIEAVPAPVDGALADLPKETGRSQVVLIFDKGGPIGRAVGAISAWHKDAFKKSYNAGVSYYFIEADDLKSVSTSFVDSAKHIITICDPKGYRATARAQPKLLEREIIPLRDSLDSPNIDSGLFGTMMKMADLQPGEDITPLSLFRLMGSLSTYPMLFFPPPDNLFSYFAGRTREWMAPFVRDALQTVESADLVVLGTDRPARFRDLLARKDDIAVFVNARALRHLMDIESDEPIEILSTAMRRGIRALYIDQDR
jgi:hypothetical protein